MLKKRFSVDQEKLDIKPKHDIAHFFALNSFTSSNSGLSYFKTMCTFKNAIEVRKEKLFEKQHNLWTLGVLKDTNLGTQRYFTPKHIV